MRVQQGAGLEYSHLVPSPGGGTEITAATCRDLAEWRTAAGTSAAKGECMANHVCPWWLGYFLVSPLRRLWQHPERVLAPFVGEGMLALEPGCGMGFFTLDLARIVGPNGRVVAVDLQEKMLAGLRRRAARAGLLDRIDVRLAHANRLGIADLAGRVDVALALHVVHEVPDAAGFFAEIAASLKPEGRLLFVEPRGHVSADAFVASLALAEQAGLRVVDRPHIRRDPAALLALK